MLAVVVSMAALLVSLVAAGYARRSAIAAERQARAAEAVIPPRPPAVDWKIEPGHDGAYRLRNIGTSTATGVRIDLPESFAGQVHADLGNGSISPGKSVDVRWYQAWMDPNLNELPVVWDGRETPQLVPIPPRPPKSS
ncbi:hypothetical protein [Actinoplanes sp. NPDC051494]|uniref:hypothetical protein n=1 Tax=Actinoplanes sp. NPDC051494 TaxID=3363907 RepID=UPI0037ADD4CC